MRNDKPNDISRREILAGAGALATGLPFGTLAMSSAENGFIDILRSPDRAYALVGDHLTELRSNGSVWRGAGVEIELAPTKKELPVIVRAQEVEPKYIQLRWNGTVPAGTRVLGDAWERGYGDLAWTSIAPNHVMPWYFMATNHLGTHGYGVKTQAGAICFWQIDSGGISLWLDIRNGGKGVKLGSRALEAAVVVSRQGSAGESPFAATHAFCRVMCEKPWNPASPIYGGNNWYYAYGEGFGAAEMVRDAEVMSSLAAPSETNRPFMVIDMGWADTSDGAGPVAKTKSSFPNMPGLAQKMKEAGARPGIWTRPLLSSVDHPATWRLQRKGSDSGLFVLDPSVPDALDYIRSEIQTLATWGFELIKHDFSTYDLLGRWGFQMGVRLTDSGWSFSDRSRTTAEIIVGFYRGLREAVGPTYLLGCNTIGHLSAGLFEASRIGDDTSGRDWNRTWKMGVNCLAFRAPQHGAFFAADADCVAITPDVPWEKTRHWLDLVSRSGTPLFVSLDPRSSTPEVLSALKTAFARAAKPQPLGEPLNWADTTTPTRWKLNGEDVTLEWSFGECLSPFAG